MAQIEEIGNIKGPKGDDVRNPRIVGTDLVIDEVTRTPLGTVTTSKVLGNVKGQDGVQGAPGVPGLPGTNGVATDSAVGTNLATANTETRGAALGVARAGTERSLYGPRVSNVATNPSFAVDLAGYEVTNGTLSRESAPGGLPAGGSTFAAVVTASGASALMSLLTANASRIPIAGGDWVGVRAAVGTDSGVQARIGVIWHDAAGASISSVGSSYAAADLPTLSRVAEFIGQAPSNAASFRLEVRGYSGASGTNLTPGKRLYVRAIGIHVAASSENARAAVAAGYRDGSSLGWRWTGAVGASTSESVTLRDELGKATGGILAADYGVKGDGTTDDTVALKAALVAATGKTLVLPRGRYPVNQRLDVPAGTTLRGEPGTVLINTGNLPTLLQFGGTVGPAVKLETAVGTNARVINTSTAHGFVQGDIVRFTSQRISTSADAGDWRLGFSTGTSPGPFFGEFGTVQSVQSATSFTLDSGLIFPGYRPDKTQETDTAAGDFATVSKIVGGRNVVIRDIEIEGPADIAIVALNAIDSLVSNVRYVKTDIGRFVQLQGCYRTEARDCWVSNDIDMVANPDPNLFSINSFHIAGSQSSGFDRCTVVSGTQGFDITYMPSGTNRIPSTRCYVRNSRSSAALRGPLTAHPGTYAPVITGNDFSECGTGGIVVRGNRAVVTNNVVQGSGSGYGIFITEGGGKDAQIAGNQVSNFDTGLAVVDGAGKVFEGRIGVIFNGNVVIDCLTGYARVCVAGRPLPLMPDGIVVENNKFYSTLANAIGIVSSLLNRATWGLAVRGNTFRLNGSGSVVFNVGSNSRSTSLVANTIVEAATVFSRDTSNSGHLWTVPTVVEFSGNVVVGEGVGVDMPANDANFMLKSRDRGEPLRVTGSIDLAHYKEGIVMRPVSTNQATVAAGFPTEAAACDIEVVRRSDSSFTQHAKYVAGDLYTRWWTTSGGGAWSPWTKRY